MNAQLRAFRTQAQREQEDLFPCEVTIGGVIYEGSTSGVKRGLRTQEDGGSVEVRECTFRIFKSRFDQEGRPVPKDRQKLEYLERNWKIERVMDDENDVAVVLHVVGDVAR